MLTELQAVMTAVDVVLIEGRGLDFGFSLCRYEGGWEYMIHEGGRWRMSCAAEINFYLQYNQFEVWINGSSFVLSRK